MTKHTTHTIIKIKTPLNFGSYASDFMQNSPIQKDFDRTKEHRVFSETWSINAN